MRQSLLMKSPISNWLTPVVGVPPVGKTAVLGGGAGFYVTAGGARPLAYRWLKGGVEMAGQTNRYRVTVYDQFGNERSATTTIVPSVPVNQAPQPFIRVSPVIAGPGEDVLLDASQTFDPEQSAGFLEVEWDLNGDGAFDTLPTAELAGLFNFNTQGSRLIRARLTDPAGDSAISAPVALNIVECQTELSPTSRSHGYGGGANKVTVTAGLKCRWLPVSSLLSWSCSP